MIQDQSDTKQVEQEARRFAEERHAGQRYGERPYGTHLSQVRQVLADFGHDGDLGVAAWLHDTIEDTGVTQEDLAARFSAPVAALVWAVSGEGQNRKQRNASAYQKIRALPQAAVLKLADRIANVEACLPGADGGGRPDKLAMYRAEWPGFAAALDGLGDDRMWARLRQALGV